MSRKEYGRGCASIKDCVDALIQGVMDYTENTQTDYLQQPMSVLAIQIQREQQQKLKNGRKITLWIFQATNCIGVHVDMTKNGKPQE